MGSEWLILYVDSRLEVVECGAVLANERDMDLSYAALVARIFVTRSECYGSETLKSDLALRDDRNAEGLRRGCPMTA